MIQKSRKSVDDLLAQSFKELVCQQPIEKITIKILNSNDTRILCQKLSSVKMFI